MKDVLATFQVSDALKGAVRRAAKHKMSPQEVLEQRVSFVFGLMDSMSEVTRERVRELILEQEGCTDSKSS